MSKKKYLFISLVAVIAGSSTSAVTANDGTITFSGSISDATCVISGGDDSNQNQGSSFTVHMPAVSTSALHKAGQFAGDTRFYINLSGTNCPNGKVANVVFERAQSVNIDSTNGYLRNTATSGAALNTFIRVLNKDKEWLDLRNLNAAHQPITINENKAQFQYWGQYAAVGGAATAGTVSTDVVYSISYR